MATHKTRHAVYNLNYHLVWIPKYRRSVLVDAIRQRLTDMIYTIAERNGLNVLDVEVMPDHVHLFVSAPPRCSPAWLANTFKGPTARWLRQEFPSLEGEIQGKLWTRSYYVGTAGHVSAETIQRYIEAQVGT